MGLLLLTGCQSAAEPNAAGAAPAEPAVFCTRTLGAAQCFSDPAGLPDHPMPLADGRTTLTPAQEKDRAAAARWSF